MSAEAIAPGTVMGAVRLRVADVDRASGFYRRMLGLESVERGQVGVTLGAAPGVHLVELEAAPDAPPRPRGTTGLFHLAILVPGRAELGAALTRLESAGWGLTGASDHLVSEALYTSDPEGNGIEIYWDRPRAEWPGANGEIRMDTLPLDLDALRADAGEPGPAVPDGTRMGHVHLNVADIPESEEFYAGILGFGVTVRGYPGALFVSAGGYHHHLGLNTWASAGAPAPPPGARGLARFEVVVPDCGEVDRVASAAEAAGVAAEASDDGLRLSDPSGNPLLVRSAS